MTFLEVSDGLSIAIKDIKIIQELSEIRTRVVTDSASYEVALPYKILLEFLEEQKEKGIKPETEEMLQGFLKNVGTFAGR